MRLDDTRTSRSVGTGHMARSRAKNKPHAVMRLAAGAVARRRRRIPPALLLKSGIFDAGPAKPWLAHTIAGRALSAAGIPAFARDVCSRLKATAWPGIKWIFATVTPEPTGGGEALLPGIEAAIRVRSLRVQDAEGAKTSRKELGVARWHVERQCREHNRQTCQEKSHDKPLWLPLPEDYHVALATWRPCLGLHLDFHGFVGERSNPFSSNLLT